MPSLRTENIMESSDSQPLDAYQVTVYSMTAKHRKHSISQGKPLPFSDSSDNYQVLLKSSLHTDPSLLTP